MLSFLYLLMQSGSFLGAFGKVMYWFATISLLVIGTYLIVTYAFKYRRYYQKGLMSAKNTFIILGSGILFLILAVLLLLA